MDKEKKKALPFRLLRAGAAAILVVLIAYGISLNDPGQLEINRAATAPNTVGAAELSCTSAEQTTSAAVSETTQKQSETMSVLKYPEKNKDTVVFGKEYDVKNAVLINVDDNIVTAAKDERMRMYPASLTKVMTLIVAVENIEDMQDTVLITDSMVTPYVEQDASLAGFLPGETPSVKDLLYGMILTSGADAASAVAEYVAGSEEKFVALMNEKGREMGLYATHFTNVVGLHDSGHYSTAEDMAMILEYAVNNKICRKILSTEDYKVKKTEQHPDGLSFKSTLFSRMYGDEMPNVRIIGGKTGYTDKAGNCLETFAEIGGQTYILVFCGSSTKWNIVYDTLSAYSVLAAGGDPYDSSRSHS